MISSTKVSIGVIKFDYVIEVENQKGRFPALNGIPSRMTLEKISMRMVASCQN